MHKGKKKFISRRNEKSYDPIVFAILRDLDTPVSLGVYLRWKYREWNQLFSCTTRAQDYTDRLAFHKDYIATRLLSKWDGASPVDKKKVALESFRAAELDCAKTNERLTTYPYGVNPRVEAVIQTAGEKIRRLLGSITPSVIDRVLGLGGFGPGVTTTTNGDWLGPDKKLVEPQEITKRLDTLVEAALQPSDFPLWPSLHNDRLITRGNKVITVPKNSKTDRTIAVEPGINSFFQKGVGSLLRGRLRHWGINLHDQGTNQALAWAGSEFGIFDTLDLAAASDTISLEAVRLLLPPEWVRLLEALRSPCYSLNGVWHVYHKHSSMGNGYTFELETLMFSSLLFASCDVLGLLPCGTCYGDDIICPSGATSLLVETLSYLGFSLNPQKSYTSGPFRESCGSDWFEGVNVTPFYLKRNGDNVQVQRLANWLRVEAPAFFGALPWTACFEYLPRAFRNIVPLGVDGGLVGNIGDWDPTYKIQRTPHGPIVGYRVRTLLYVPLRKQPVDIPGYVRSVYVLDRSPYLSADSPYSSEISARGDKGYWRCRHVVVDDWPVV